MAKEGHYPGASDANAIAIRALLAGCPGGSEERKPNETQKAAASSARQAHYRTHPRS